MEWIRLLNMSALLIFTIANIVVLHALFCFELLKPCNMSGECCSGCCYEGICIRSDNCVEDNPCLSYPCPISMLCQLFYQPRSRVVT